MKRLKITKRLKAKEIKILKLIDNAVKTAERCIKHKFNYAFFSGNYRLYRRGKNRCRDCGLKLFKEDGNGR